MHQPSSVHARTGEAAGSDGAHTSPRRVSPSLLLPSQVVLRMAAAVGGGRAARCDSNSESVSTGVSTIKADHRSKSSDSNSLHGSSKPSAGAAKMGTVRGGEQPISLSISAVPDPAYPSAPRGSSRTAAPDSEPAATSAVADAASAKHAPHPVDITRLSQELTALVQQSGNRIALHLLPARYSAEHGKLLRPQSYGCATLPQLAAAVAAASDSVAAKVPAAAPAVAGVAGRSGGAAGDPDGLPGFGRLAVTGKGKSKALVWQGEVPQQQQPVKELEQGTKTKEQEQQQQVEEQEQQKQVKEQEQERHMKEQEQQQQVEEQEQERHVKEQEHQQSHAPAVTASGSALSTCSSEQEDATATGTAAWGAGGCVEPDGAGQAEGGASACSTPADDESTSTSTGDCVNSVTSIIATTGTDSESGRAGGSCSTVDSSSSADERVGDESDGSVPAARQPCRSQARSSRGGGGPACPAVDANAATSACEGAGGTVQRAEPSQEESKTAATRFEEEQAEESCGVAQVQENDQEIEPRDGCDGDEREGGRQQASEGEGRPGVEGGADGVVPTSGGSEDSRADSGALSGEDVEAWIDRRWFDCSRDADHETRKAERGVNGGDEEAVKGGEGGHTGSKGVGKERWLESKAGEVACVEMTSSGDASISSVGERGDGLVPSEEAAQPQPRPSGVAAVPGDGVVTSEKAESNESGKSGGSSNSCMWSDAKASVSVSPSAFPPPAHDNARSTGSSSGSSSSRMWDSLALLWRTAVAGSQEVHDGYAERDGGETSGTEARRGVEGGVGTMTKESTPQCESAFGIIADDVEGEAEGDEVEGEDGEVIVWMGAQSRGR